MKKGLLSTIVIIGIMTYVMGNIAYSFFAVDIDFNNTIKLATIFTGDYMPVFTASSDGNISLEVSEADMLMTAENSPAATKRGIINIYMEEADDKKQATCTYDFMYESIEKNGYSKYIPSSQVKEKGLLEYTIKIIDDEDNVVVEEKSINEFKNGDIITSGLSISSSGKKVSKNYYVIATIYNLNIKQNIINKKYGFKINTTNIDCQVTK